MSETNIDAALVRGSEAALSRTEERLVEMTNGCICCTLRDDLLEEVDRFAREGRFDYLLIESSGISEPMPVAATFSFARDDGATLDDLTRLDTMVTVVDAANFLAELGTGDELAERGLAPFEDDKRTVSDLLIDQVEFADVIVLNKLDLVDGASAERLRGVLARLNPGARLVEAVRGQVRASDVLGTGLFDLLRAMRAQDAAVQHRGLDREVRGLGLPPLVVESDEFAGGVAGGVREGCAWPRTGTKTPLRRTGVGAGRGNRLPARPASQTMPGTVRLPPGDVPGTAPRYTAAPGRGRRGSRRVCSTPLGSRTARTVPAPGRSTPPPARAAA
ncbi:hypothetical protein JK364_51020 [Streptomyces sp. 110]|uniref:CobW/HypB/UreG nucleotide-binding domain-containing protein n=1 Tax=Streptomyces endocoffeicus TaxID=2898945 RepID=A0ABS1Q7D9_9ACTN|nr:hypothetical protein [Streptomyces endocoffeicus]